MTGRQALPWSGAQSPIIDRRDRVQVVGRQPLAAEVEFDLRTVRVENLVEKVVLG